MRIQPYGRQAPIYDLLESRQGLVLKEDGEGMLVLDRSSRVFFLDQPDPETALKWVSGLMDHDFRLVVMGEDTARYLLERLDLEHGPYCVQCVYDKEEMPRPHPFIKPASMSDLVWMAQTDPISRKELESCLSKGLVVKAEVDGIPAGYCGIHLDGSLGFLYVMPVFRHKGLGTLLEKAAIRKAMKLGLIPYCHVYANNTISLELQHKCGLTFCQDRVLWCWHKA